MAVIQFAHWQYRLADGELIHPKGSIRLQPRIAKLLSKLLQFPNQILSREELIDYIWGEKSVNEDALSRCIAELRSILQDDSNDPKYIETIPKKGYRFICPLQQASKKPLISNLNLFSWFGATLLLISVMGVWIYKTNTKDHLISIYQTGLANAKRITVDTDLKWHPQVNHAGDKVAYSTKHEDFLAIKLVDLQGKTLDLINEVGSHLMSPSFSPTDEELLFVQLQAKACQIYRYQLFNKQKQKLAECAAPEATSLLDWSPDGRYMVYVAPERSKEDDRNPKLQNTSIWLMDLETGSQTELTTPSNPQEFDTSPKFSPDGKSLGFIRGTSSIRNIYTLAFTPQQFSTHSKQHLTVKPLTHDAAIISHFVWLNDNAHMIFDSNKNGDRGLWLLNEQSGQVTLLGARDGQFPSLDNQNQNLVFQEVKYNANIWQLDLKQNLKPEPLITSIKYNSFPKYTPDGKRIAFVSNRKGKSSVWLYDIGAKSQTEIIQIANTDLTLPVWDQQGENLLISSRGETGYQCYQLSISTRSFETLSEIQGQHFGCVYGASGEIYAISREPNEPSYLFKLKGSNLTRITNFSVNQVALTNNDKVVYSTPDSNGIFLMTDNGESINLAPDYKGSWSVHWVVRDNYLYFARFQQAAQSNGEIAKPGLYQIDLTSLEQNFVSAELPSAIGNTIDVDPLHQSILLVKTDSVEMNLYHAKLNENLK